MPRPFTDAEKMRIRDRLVEVAREHFARYGIRRASVADIAAEARIGKGTVYLFFPSKSLLFLEVARQAEEQVRVALLDEVGAPGRTPRERFEALVRFQFRVLREHPVLAILLDPAEAEVLFRELPPEVMAENARDDDAFFAELAARWQRAGEMAPVDGRSLGALARAIYAICLERNVVGEDDLQRVADLLATGLAAGLVPERGEAP